MNDNWPVATEVAVDAASAALNALVEAQGAKAVPGMIAALVNWAVLNGAAPPMARALSKAIEALPVIDALWKVEPCSKPRLRWSPLRVKGMAN